MFGLDGLSARARVQYANGRAFSEPFVGDAQTVSGIEAVDGLRVYELWLQRSFGARTEQSLLLGLYDLNSEFETLDSSGLFIHSVRGIGHDIVQIGRNRTGNRLAPPTIRGGGRTGVTTARWGARDR